MNLKKTHSLVIGSKQVDYCSIVKKGKRSILNSLAYYDFNFDNFEEIDEIIESVSEIAGKDALFNLSIMGHNVIKHIYFYKKGAANIKANVLRDLKSDYEIQLQDYLIDYEAEELEDKKVVFVAAYPKGDFDKLYGFIKKRKNIKLFSLEIGMVSVKRLINSFYNKNETKLCIRMDKDFTNIFALKGDIIVVSREIQYGFDGFVDDIMESGGVDKQKALDVLENIGLYKDENFTQQEQQANEIITASFDKMSIEIQRTIDYLSSSRKMGGVNKIITLGFLNFIKKSDVYLSKLFSVGVEKLETAKMIEFDSSVDFSMVKDMFYFDVAAGAAMRDLL